MASIVFFRSPPLSSPLFPHQFPLNPSSLPLSLRLSGRQRTWGTSLVTRGAPGTSTYIFALVLPLSLIAATVFTSIKIADKLDRDFLEEVAVNQAIMEENEDGGEVEMPLEKKPSLPRRNRPKREAETSTM